VGSFSQQKTCNISEKRKRQYEARTKAARLLIGSCVCALSICTKISDLG